jgi:hypothetical protein
MVTLFERLAQARPAQTEPARKAPPSELEAGQILLDWLQNWTKPTIALRDIRIFAPRCLRSRESAISAAQILVQNGWLVPTQTHRHDRQVWKIIHKTVVRPRLTAENPSRALL